MINHREIYNKIINDNWHDELMRRWAKYIEGITENEDNDNDDDAVVATIESPVRFVVRATPHYNKKNEKDFKPLYCPDIKRVLFRDPATIVFFEDGSKTTAVCGEEDKYDKEVGLSVCMLKRVLGNQAYRSIMDKWCYKEEGLN